MVGDGLDWVRVFGCGLEMDERLYMGGGKLKMSRSGLSMNGNGWEWAEMSRSGLKMSGSGW